MKARWIDPRNASSLSETPVTLWRSDRAQREFGPTLFRSRNSRIPCLSATNNVISFGFFGRLSPAGLPKELCGTGHRPLWPVVYKKVAVDWQAGKGYMGGSACLPPGEKAQKILRAIDIQTGKIAWELPEHGPGESWGA